MTRTGRRHVNLVRFARSIAGSGATVIVPEVPEWVALRLAPDCTREAVLAGVEALEQDPGVQGAPGLMGFSFGGPQALRIAGDPALAGRLACVAAFGGYGELDRTLEFLLTGTHEWLGRRYQVQPDPYGRWVVAANYLTRVPGFQDAAPVAEALWELAAYAGDHFIEAWDPRLDRMKMVLEEALPDPWRPLFRLFAPPAADDPPPRSAETDAWRERIRQGGLAVDPELELPPELRVPVPVFLVHGRNDHLIPHSETLRLAQRVRAPSLAVAVTGLFSHSAGDPRPHGAVGWTREVLRLGRVLQGILGAP
jgi:dienelactone hydrolase